MATLVPNFDGKPKKLHINSASTDYKSGNKVNFNYKNFCRYEVTWPMDSTFGDKIRFKVQALQQTEVIVALGKTYDAKTTR